MGGASRSSAPRSPSVLVIYGDPPSPPLVDSTGRPLGKDLTVTGANQASFESALRQALATYFGAHVRMANARMVRVGSASAFLSTLKREKFAHLIYYGHALLGTNSLQPARGRSISARQIVEALKGTAVRHFDLLGCETTSLAAQLSGELPQLEVGYLRGWRQDNFEVDSKTLRMKNITFDPAQLRHFGVKRQ